MKRASYLLFASVLLACASPLWGQQLQAAKAFPSTPDKAVGVVIAESAGGWLVFAVPSMTPVQGESINSGCGIVWEGPAGRYLVLYFPAGQSFPQPEVITRDLGIAGPVTPPDKPDPPQPPVTSAVRAAVIEESNDRTPEQAAVLTDPRLTAMKKAGKLLVVDKDATDSSGKPSAEASQVDGPLPRVIALDQAGRRSGAGVDLPASADEFVRLLESWGVK